MEISEKQFMAYTVIIKSYKRLIHFNVYLKQWY